MEHLSWPIKNFIDFITTSFYEDNLSVTICNQLNDNQLQITHASSSKFIPNMCRDWLLQCFVMESCRGDFLGDLIGEIIWEKHDEDTFVFVEYIVNDTSRVCCITSFSTAILGFRSI